MLKSEEVSLNEKAIIYAFLKVVFGKEPSQELLKYLQLPDVFESLKSTGLSLSRDDLGSSRLPKLVEDYTQLFIGPGKHIALNESVYTEETPQFWGESAVKIKRFIDSIGLHLDENWTLMPDHISVEFELMQKLLEKQSEALKEKDQQTVEQCKKAINILFNEHILRWIPQVCDKVVEKALTPVYKAVGVWTKTLLQFP